MNASALRREYVIDTSVTLKWFLQKEEADLEKARDLKHAQVEGRCSLYAPIFILLEIANALVRGHRRNPDYVGEALDAVRELEVDLEAMRESTLVHAVHLASSYGVTVYDSYFLAMAIESGRVLVTADDAFIRKVGAHPNMIALRQLQNMQ